MGIFPVESQIFSLSHTHVMLIRSLLTFHYISLATQAQMQELGNLRDDPSENEI